MRQHERFGGMAARKAAVPRRLDQRHHLLAVLHRTRHRARVLDAHLSRDKCAQEGGDQLERVPGAFGMKIANAAEKGREVTELREDLRVAVAPQIGVAADMIKLVSS